MLKRFALEDELPVAEEGKPTVALQHNYRTQLGHTDESAHRTELMKVYSTVFDGTAQPILTTACSTSHSCRHKHMK